MHYLLAAEADKIQDFVFRATHLREVSGGSALLTRFCEEVPRRCLGCKEEDIIISDGGAFRLLFDSEKDAEEAGRTLADLYYMVTGCSLTVAPPETWDGTDGSFKAANTRVGNALRIAKSEQNAVTTPHIPHIALCTSTGIEMAERFASPKQDRPDTYLSRSSLIKQREQASGKEFFVRDFIAHVLPDGIDVDNFDAPQDAGDAGRAGGYDYRDYVAYLVADGNGIGTLFDRCETPREIKTLSQRLSEIVRNSLAEPTKLLMYRSKQKGDRFIPVLPMILGGDDIFVLLPATWSLSFAQMFCQTFENSMVNFLQQELQLTEISKPTMAAAVIICKSKYPFQLAYQRGKTLLEEAKKLGKHRRNEHHSAVNFEVVVGNRLTDSSREKEYRPTLRPYWVGSGDDQSLPLQHLLDTRYDLRRLPQKRIAQLRALFESSKLNRDELDQWIKDVQAVIKRIGQLSGDENHASGDGHNNDEGLTRHLFNALKLLGNEQDAHYLRTVKRSTGYVYGNALPHVFDAWDYLYDFQRDLAAYEE
jgi:hypothetical protein